mgnify:FL=1
MGKVGRCIAEGVSIVAIANIVEPMFTESYRNQTMLDSQCRNVKHVKFKAVENYIVNCNNSHPLRKTHRTISELDLEEFTKNLLGDEVLLDIVESGGSNSSHPGTSQNKGSPIEHVIALLAQAPVELSGRKLIGENERADYIDWSLVSPGQYSADLIKKLALQVGLTVASIAGFNKLFGYVPTWTFNRGLQPHLFRRYFKLGLVGILSYVFMNATIEALYEASEEMAQEEFEQSALFGGPQFPNAAPPGVGVMVRANGPELYPYSGDEPYLADRAGATPQDPFHSNRLAHLVVLLPTVHEGLIYTVFAFKRFSHISGSPALSCVLTALCYSLSKWSETDVQSALLGFPVEDTDSPDAYSDMERIIYNFSRSLMLNLSYIATKNVAVPVAMYSITNVHMLFDEFLLRNDFIKEKSFVWDKVVQLTAVASIIYGKFHDALIRLRKAKVLHSHINVINNGSAVPAIQQLCKEGMDLFGALEDPERMGVPETEQEMLRRQWNSYIDFGIAYSMATWYLNRYQQDASDGSPRAGSQAHGRLPGGWPSGGSANRVAAAGDGFSAPLWKKLEDNRKHFSAQAAAVEKESNKERGAAAAFNSGDVFGAFEAIARDLMGVDANDRPFGPESGADGLIHPFDSSVNSYLELFSYETVVEITKLLFPPSCASSSSAAAVAHRLFISQKDYENTVVEHLSGVDDAVLDQVNYAQLRRAMFFWEEHADEEDVLNLVEAVNTHVMRRMEAVAAQHGAVHNRTGFPTYISKASGIEAQTCSSRYYRALDEWEDSCRRKEMITALRPYGLTLHRYNRVLAKFGSTHPEVQQLAREWNAYFSSDEFTVHLRQIARSN